MDVGDLYNFVLLVVLIGMLLGVGLVVLGNFGSATGVVGTGGQVVINNTIIALAPIAATWMPLIVTVSVLAIILKLVIGSFGAGQR